MTYNDYLIESFDERCLGELHRLVERLAIGSDLVTDCADELERIFRSSAKA